MKAIFSFLSVFLILCNLSCSNDDGDGPLSQDTRSFHMGFTPWPYAATFEAQDEIYNFINEDADMVAHHLDGGVPWLESLTEDNFENYGDNLKNEILGRVNQTNNMQNKTVYLGVSPFNNLRDSIALYWNTSTNQSLPSPWDGYSISNNAIISAYTNFVDELIKQFDPDYINYAIEANEFYHNVPSERSELIIFLSSVYNELKNRYPNKNFMVSFAMSSPGSTKMNETAEFFNLAHDFIDIVGISIYPYAFYSHANKGNPENLPVDWISQIEIIAPNKPYFVAETGFLGESLAIPAFGLDVTSNEDRQAAYLDILFEEMEDLGTLGVVWFSAYDFDDLWSNLLNDNLSLIWRDTGLKDGNQNPRKALDTWNERLSYSKDQ